MNPFKCRHCDLSAHFYFREGGMLCVDHAEAFCLAQAQDMMQRSRLDKSVSDGGGTRSLPTREIEPSVMLARTPSESNSACASLEAPPGTSSAALSGSSGTPGQGRPLTPFKNATTFRVTADNSIQDSSHI